MGQCYTPAEAAAVQEHLAGGGRGSPAEYVELEGDCYCMPTDRVGATWYVVDAETGEVTEEYVQRLGG